jgi:lysophospholipase L1-like esterase
MLGEMRAAADVLGAGGATVVFLTAPPAGPVADLGGGTDDPARTERLNELMAQVADERPDQVAVVDLDGFLAGADDTRLRPDGVHFSPETAEEVSGEFLGPALVDEFDEGWLEEWRQDNAITEIPNPLRVLVVGDSTAGEMYRGFQEWNLDHNTLQLAYPDRYGCGFGRGGRIDYQGSVDDVPAQCDAWPEQFAQAIDDFKPHVVVVLVGPFDVTDRQLAGDDVWRAPGDPVYDEFIRSEYEAVADTVAADGALVVWLTSPRIDLGRVEIPPPPEPYPASDPARMNRLNEIIGDLAADRDDVFLVDLAGHLATYPGGEVDPVRPDGVHLTPESGKVVADWLLPEITGLYQDLIDENHD